MDVASLLEETAYKLWEIGKPPEWALEVASPSTYQRDIYEKPHIYAMIGIKEYWLFDPTGGKLYGRPLTGYKLVDGAYEPIEIAPNEHGLQSGYSEARLCSLERERQSELEAIQPNLVLDEDYCPAQLLLQNPETGLYILNDTAVRMELERAEVRWREAENRMRRAEGERDAAMARAEAAEAEAARLREGLGGPGSG